MHPAITRWRNAWLALACALALHTADEALTGFVPIYNDVMAGIRSRHPWMPLPTFSFPVWLGGLVLANALLFLLTPAVSRGARWLRVASMALGTIVAGNGVVHIGASFLWGTLAPGAISSPFIIVAGVLLAVAAARAGNARTSLL